ncbi:AtzH-like domain-containing protein [Streptomyces cavernae]|uniref:AtzH-like domain-containing protein n=1 Tax=Streptomyces cavernae TaxID=2259034 RepID=UPI001EE43B75|nr:AtzH-like domain-containing protein [Streptomyces cavernae]
MTRSVIPSSAGQGRQAAGASVHSDHPLPADLIDAFWAYDRALLSNDTVALDASFASGGTPLRADAFGVLVGHEAISAFRSARTTIPNRRVTRVHVRLPAAGLAIIMAEVAGPRGARGLQTQVWQRIDGCWRVTAAHVSAPAEPLDSSVWRAVGAPLVPATGDGGLAGQTVAVKDVYAVAGFATGAGVRDYLAEGQAQPAHAGVVATLLDAGADIIGIAHTDEFAYSITGRNGRYGMPVNPAAPGRVPGGSTSGPAVAVARGDATVGLGTDTAGSIRVPGSYQGLWGMRTTHGAVDPTGMVPLAPSFDAVGWLTRDVDTLLKVAEVLLPWSAGDAVPADELVTLPMLDEVADPGITAGAHAAAHSLGAVPLVLDADLEAWYRAFRTVQAYEAWCVHGAWISSHPDALSAEVAARFAAAAQVTQQQAAAARRDVGQAGAALRSALGDRFLLLPATASTPPVAGTGLADLESARDRTLRLTCLASLAGLPALTFPALRVDGIPAGLSLVGWQHSDVRLIHFARKAAAVLEGRSLRPREDHR